MIKIYDLKRYERDYNRYYSGNDCIKFPIIINGERWMIKFSESTSGFSANNSRNIHPYTSSPLSEYLGSHIYESLEIPVHKIILGYREDKVTNRLLPAYKNVTKCTSVAPHTGCLFHLNNLRLVSYSDMHQFQNSIITPVSFKMISFLLSEML